LEKLMNYRTHKRLNNYCQPLFALTMAVGLLAAAPPSSDTLVITAQTDSNGFSPVLSGNPANWFYATTIPSNTAVADTIPVQFTLNDTNAISEITPYTVTLKAVGQIAGSIGFDTTSFSIADGQSTTHYVYINTINLAAGDYHANVQVSATPPNSVATSHGIIHLLIHVGDAGNPPTCFITDSDGLLLQDCGGQPVPTGGEFLIVTNAKKITATNPGQFYYNLIWQNTTGGDVTFTSLGLNGTNVIPAGTNSVHALIYNSNQFTANFDDVNTNGTPCGQTGTACKSPITVPAGQTFWLTWHVAYQWTGSPLWPDIPSIGSCPLPSVHGTITMSALLQNADQSVSITCAGSANGYTSK
jgi:hypothetical protein